MNTSDKEKERLEDTYVYLTQQGASLIHHIATPIAIARANLDFLSRYLPALLDHYQNATRESGKPSISAEHLSAMQRAPALIAEQLDTVQTQVKSHWQSMNREVAGIMPNFQLSLPGKTATLDKIIHQPQSVKILLVEDEEIHRDVAKKILIPAYAVDTANSGEEAVALCAQSFYDLVLMDLYLPGINGQETARKIRESNNRNAIIIGLTNMPLGNQEEDDALNAYLSKPLDLQALRSCLTKIKKQSENSAD